MNTPAHPAAEAPDAWLDANQGLLTAEFARFKRLLRGEPDADGDIQGSRAWRAGSSWPASWPPFPGPA